MPKTTKRIEELQDEYSNLLQQRSKLYRLIENHENAYMYEHAIHDLEFRIQEKQLLIEEAEHQSNSQSSKDRGTIAVIGSSTDTDAPTSENIEAKAKASYSEAMQQLRDIAYKK